MLDSLLCSCNARSQKTLVGHAQWVDYLARPQVRRSACSADSMRAVQLRTEWLHTRKDGGG